MAGRRASLSGRGRIRTRHPSPPLFASAIRLRYLPPLFVAITRRLPPPAACHYPPPATSATVACHPCRCLPSRRYRPPPASFLLPLPVIIRCCLHPRRFSPAVPAASHPAACVPAACVPAACYLRHRCLPPLSLSASPLPVAFPRLLSPAACRPLPPPLSASPLLPAVPPLLTSRTRCLPFPPPCAGRADRWAAAAPRVVGRGAMRRRREVLRNNLENRKILPIFVSVKYRGSGLSRPGFLFFIGLSFLWQKRLSI